MTLKNDKGKLENFKFLTSNKATSFIFLLAQLYHHFCIYPSVWLLIYCWKHHANKGGSDLAIQKWLWVKVANEMADYNSLRAQGTLWVCPDSWKVQPEAYFGLIT